MWSRSPGGGPVVHREPPGPRLRVGTGESQFVGDRFGHRGPLVVGKVAVLPVVADRHVIYVLGGLRGLRKLVHRGVDLRGKQRPLHPIGVGDPLPRRVPRRHDPLVGVLLRPARPEQVLHQAPGPGAALHLGDHQSTCFRSTPGR